jgi:hypothetical protein
LLNIGKINSNSCRSIGGGGGGGGGGVVIIVEVVKLDYMVRDKVKNIYKKKRKNPKT